MAPKHRKSPVTDEQILSNYAINKSAYKTGKDLGISFKTVYLVLTKAGVPRNGISEYRHNAMLFRGQESDIRALYEVGATLDEIRQKFGPASDYAYKYAIRRAGGEMREHRAQGIKTGELDTIISLNAAGLGQVAIALQMGRSQSFVGRAMRRHGIAPQTSRSSVNSPWQGGRYKDTNGYIRAWIPKDDPMKAMALSEGHVLEHRLVMARHLGRVLLRSETVHHINGDRTDNRIENLELRQGKHGKHVVMCCLDCGSRNIGHVGIGKAETSIIVDGKVKRVGSFRTFAEAEAAASAAFEQLEEKPHV